MAPPTDEAASEGIAAMAADVAREPAGEGGSPGRTAGAPSQASRVLRVEVNGSLHDWFDIAEMGDFVRSPNFADTLLENIARYFGVPVENQAIYDEDGLLTTSADFSRALQRVAPMLYIYDVNDMGPELKERTADELATINAGVEQSWKNLGMLRRGGQKINEESFNSQAEKSLQPLLEPRDNNGDDALFSAKPASPATAAGLASQIAIGSSAKFGNEVVTADGQVDPPPVQVYSLLAPTTDSPSKAGMSTPTLRLGVVEGPSTAGCPSTQTTARTAFSAAARNEAELFTGRSGTARLGSGISSPPGPHVRKTASPLMTPLISLQSQQSARTADSLRHAAWHPSVSQSPVQPARARSTAAPATMILGSGQSMSWPPGVNPLSSATAPPGVNWGMDMSRMVSSSQLLGQSVNMERPVSPTRPLQRDTRPLTPKPSSARSVTPPPGPHGALNFSIEARSGAQARAVTPPPGTHGGLNFSIEARCLTPTSRGMQARILNSGPPPPLSPAQVSARNAGLVRMPSNNQVQYAPLRSMDRSVSPRRATTPTPMAARSLTPTSSVQQIYEQSTAEILRQARTSAAAGPLRATLPTASAAGNASIRALTPTRYDAHRAVLGGSHFAGPGQISLGGGLGLGLQGSLGGFQDTSLNSGYSSGWLEAGGLAMQPLSALSAKDVGNISISSYASSRHEPGSKR